MHKTRKAQKCVKNKETPENTPKNHYKLGKYLQICNVLGIIFWQLIWTNRQQKLSANENKIKQHTLNEEMHANMHKTKKRTQTCKKQRNTSKYAKNKKIHSNMQKRKKNSQARNKQRNTRKYAKKSL